MEFLRMYLGEMTGLVLVLLVLFIAAALASHHFPDRRRIRTVRNICIAAVVAAFAATLVFSLIVNQTPRGRINRADADQDQKAFEARRANQTK